MILRVMFAVCIVFPVISFSKTLLINVDTAYSMGTRTIVTSDGFTFSYDTIKFSNGVSLYFSRFNFYTTPESGLNLIGLVIDSSKALLSAGFRSSKTATWQGDTTIFWVPRFLTFYKSPDTLAYLSKQFPDLLVHPDSLYVPFSTRHEWGKWLFAFESGCYSVKCPDRRTARLAGSNNILYLRTNKNKLKFQVTNIFISQHAGDSIRILWSTDSRGNGIFKDDASVRNLENPPGYSAQTSGPGTIKWRTLRDLMQCEAPVVLYNFMGQKTGFIRDHKVHHISAGSSAAGILFYAINFPGKPVERGKVLVR